MADSEQTKNPKNFPSFSDKHFEWDYLGICPLYLTQSNQKIATYTLFPASTFFYIIYTWTLQNCQTAFTSVYRQLIEFDYLAK